MMAVSATTVWIDLLNPTPEEDKLVESQLGISVPTRAETREIEASNRLYQENGASYLTAFIVYNIEAPVPGTSTLTFILAGQRLVTVRYSEPKAIPLFLSRV
jgi:magnesium transporter